MVEGTTIAFPAELVQEAGLYDPKVYLLSSADRTDLPCIYANQQNRFTKNPHLPMLICAFGPSGAGKDTLIMPLAKKGLVNFATTATSRNRRIEEGEPEDAYVWMRGQEEGESDKDFVANLAREYDLVEYDFHHGCVYGVPRSSLVEAMKKGVALVRVDNAGAQTITQAFKGEANVLNIFVTPDSFDQLWTRIQGRNNAVTRMKDSIRYVKGAPEIAHYYIHNPQDEKGYSSLAQESLERLIAREAGLK